MLCLTLIASSCGLSSLCRRGFWKGSARLFLILCMQDRSVSTVPVWHDTWRALPKSSSQAQDAVGLSLPMSALAAQDADWQPFCRPSVPWKGALDQYKEIIQKGNLTFQRGFRTGVAC